MKIFLAALLVSVVSLEAKDISRYIKDFKDKKYERVCEKGSHLYYSGYKDENFVSLVGISCSKVDRINILGMLQRSLVNSPSSRENASYFSSLVLQKRLIYQFMIDDIDITALQLPSSTHILSRVFDALSAKNYKTLSASPKLLEIDDGGRKIIVGVSDDFPKRVQVDEFKEDGSMQRHWYQ